MNRNEVIADICTAFHGVSREDGISLHETDVIDDYGTLEERLAARQLDTDTSWEDVPSPLIEQFCEAFGFLDPKGFRYYIPAFMRWTLKHFDTSGSSSIDYTIYAFDHSDNAASREKYEALSNAQRVACSRFLTFMAADSMERFVDTIVARRALREYWGQHLPSGD
jgi:hypothetical protein